MTDNKMIYITENDLKRLKVLIHMRKSSAEDAKYIHKLEQELTKSKVVDSHKIPADTITMNSRVILKDLDTQETMEYTIVFPEDADLKNNKISILAPIGTALLGYREGDIIEWHVPAGLCRLLVEKVIYQPEAAGDFHL